MPDVIQTGFVSQPTVPSGSLMQTSLNVIAGMRSLKANRLEDKKISAQKHLLQILSDPNLKVGEKRQLIISTPWMELTELGANLLAAERERLFPTPFELARTRYYGARAETPAGTPFIPSRLKDYSEEMDVLIDEAEMTPLFGFNYHTKEGLVNAWNKFKAGFGYEQMPQNQKQQLWELWKDRVEDKAKRYKFNPNDPEWQAASGMVETPPGPTDVRMQSAPDVRLDSYWQQLTEKQKADIWLQYEKDPASIDFILDMIRNAHP